MTSHRWEPQKLSKDTVVLACVVFCLLNVILVLTLAGAGVLKTAERGDVTYTKIENTPNDDIVLPDDTDDRFVVERPTDVDAFYDAVVRIQHGGPLINPWGDAHTIQRYHYHPSIIFVFYPLYFLGYLGFKLAWLLLSVGFTACATYLLIMAEADHWDVLLSQRRAAVLSLAAVGFEPMVTNFKSGQTTPFMFLFVALCWWYYRRGDHLLGGAVLSIPFLVKPYFMAPLVLYFRRDRAVGVLGFVGAGIAANVIAVFMLGVDTIVAYYEELLQIASHVGRGDFQNTGFEVWFANSLRLFYWFDDLVIVVHLVFAIPLAYATLNYLLERETIPADMFAYSAGLVMLFFPGGSVVDLAMVVAAFVVLGFRIHVHGTGRAMAVLGVSFLLMHVHTYVLEFFVGAGPTYLPILMKHERLIVQVIPYIQPAMWGLLLLWGLLTLSIFGLVPWQERAVASDGARS